MGSTGKMTSNENATPVEAVTTSQMRSLDDRELRKAENIIKSTSFKNVGNGNWEFTGPYDIGAQILDETGSTKALREGFFPNEKAYSVQTWGQAPGDVYTMYYHSLNEAKQLAKEQLKDWLKSVQIKK